MRKPLAFLLLLILAAQGLSRAACPVGPYIVRAQSNLNQFKTLYPQCEELDGLVVNGSQADNLAPLSDIKKINGNATFKESFRFLALSGMSSLKTIEGSLVVDDMDSVLDFAGLEALERIGGDFIIQTNDQLTDLGDLISLKEIGGKLEIVGNTNLSSLFGPPNLRFLGLTPFSDLIVESNPVLKGLDGLQSLEEVKGKVAIFSNTLLANVDGLSGLARVDSAVSITRNDALENVDGLGKLAAVRGMLEINSNKKLKRIALGALKEAGKRISFSANAELRKIEGIDSLEVFAGELLIRGNVLLDTIRAFRGLRRAGNLIDFSNNGPLPDFGFLRSLERVPGDFMVATSQPVAFTGMGQLARVEGDFAIQSAAPSLAGLEGLQYVGRKLHIGGDSLRNITALANLDTVRQLTITYNQKLASLEGLDNLDPEALTEVIIQFNRLLGHCAVKSICGFQARPGKLYAGSNTGGCLDTAAIRKSCKDPSPIASAPAPPLRPRVESGAEGLRILIPPGAGSPVRVRVHDPEGKLIAVRDRRTQPRAPLAMTIPIEGRAQGVYLVEIRLGAERTVFKTAN